MDIKSTLKLNNGLKIPRLGFGTWQLSSGRESESAVSAALVSGYRHLDTAHYYRNEESVGKSVRESGIPRNELFITTKLWDSGLRDVQKAFDESSRKLNAGSIDLYLMHFPFTPVAARKKAWQEMERLYNAGKCHSIGVSNFTIRHLEELLSYSSVVPAVNQVEFSPYLFQKELMEFCQKKKVQLVSYAPLTQAKKFRDKKLVELSNQYQKTPAQLLLRWALQHDLVAIPKSRSPDRIAENANVFDFSISALDLKSMDSWNENYRTCWNPTNAP